MGREGREGEGRGGGRVAQGRKVDMFGVYWAGRNLRFIVVWKRRNDLLSPLFCEGVVSELQNLFFLTNDTDSNSTVNSRHTSQARTQRNSRKPSIPELSIHFMREWHLAIRATWKSELQQRRGESASRKRQPPTTATLQRVSLSLAPLCNPNHGVECVSRHLRCV